MSKTLEWSADKRKEATDVLVDSGQMECFLLFSNMEEDLISGIRGDHQQTSPLRVFLSLGPGGEIRETGSVH